MLGDEMPNLAFALPLSIDADQRGTQYLAALLLQDRWPHNHIDGPGLVFQGHEDHAFGRAGELATYTCDNLQKVWKPKVGRNGNKQNPKVWGCLLPGTTNLLVWRKSDGSIEYPHISDRDAKRYGNSTPQEQKLVARPTDLAKAEKSRRRSNPNKKVRKVVFGRISGHAKRRQADSLPMMATMEVAGNKKQAIAESNEELGKTLLGVLTQNQSSPAKDVSELMDAMVGQGYEEPEDNSGLFDANFNV